MSSSMGEEGGCWSQLSGGTKAVITLVAAILLIATLLGIILLVVPVPCNLLNRILGVQNPSSNQKCEPCTNSSETPGEVTSLTVNSPSTTTSKMRRRDETVTSSGSNLSAAARDEQAKTQYENKPSFNVTFLQAPGAKPSQFSSESSFSRFKAPEASSKTPESRSLQSNRTSTLIPTVYASTVASTVNSETSHRSEVTETTETSSRSTRTASFESSSLSKKYNEFTRIAQTNAQERKSTQVTVSPMQNASSELLPRCERVLAFMNNSHDPCDNFYQYACGKFKVNSKKKFLNTYDLDQHVVREITMFALLNESIRSEVRPLKYIGKFFQKCLDEETVKKNDWKPIGPLARDVSLSYSNTREKAIATSVMYQVPTVIAFSIEVDPSDSQKQIVVINHPSALIDMKDLKANKSDLPATERRSAFKKFLESVIKASLKGEPKKDLEGDVKAIWALEMALADIAGQGDQRLNAKRSTVDKLQDEVEGLNLTAVVENVLGGAPITEVIIKDVNYLKKLSKVLKQHKNTLRRYSDWRAVASYGWTVSPFVADAMFEYSRVKTGAPSKPTRRDKCLDTLFFNAPFVIGRAYIDAANFTRQDKKRAEEFVGKIQKSIARIIEENQWMDEETKRRASDKIGNIIAEVGYPEWIRDNSLLTKSFPLTPPKNDSLIEYLIQIKTHSFKERINKLNEQAQWSGDWMFSPAWPMGGYHLSKNRILLPAANLFDPDRCHFGGVPADVGAEITYAVDRNGAVFDEKKIRKNWWTELTANQFESLTQSIIKNNPEIVEPLPADFNDTYAAYLGGIRVLYSAVFDSEKHWNFDPLPNTTIKPRQLFFLSYAYLWCADQQIKETSLWDSKWEYRTNVPLKNFEKFAEAFSCPRDSPMNPSNKIRVW